MTIQVACACGAKLNAKDELAGKRVACPKCKQPLVIQAAATAPAAAPAAASADDPLALGGFSDLEQATAPAYAPAPTPMQPTAPSAFPGPGTGPTAPSPQAAASGNKKTLLIAGIVGGAALLLLLVVGGIIVGAMMMSGGTEVADNSAGTTGQDASINVSNNQLGTPLGNRQQPVGNANQTDTQSVPPPNAYIPQGNNSAPSVAPTNNNGNFSPGPPGPPPEKIERKWDPSRGSGNAGTTAESYLPVWFVLTDLEVRPVDGKYEVKVKWKVSQGQLDPGKQYRMVVSTRKPNAFSSTVHIMPDEILHMEGSYTCIVNVSPDEEAINDVSVRELEPPPAQQWDIVSGFLELRQGAQSASGPTKAKPDA